MVAQETRAGQFLELSVFLQNCVQVRKEFAAKDEEFWSWGKQLYIDLARKYLDEGVEKVK